MRKFLVLGHFIWESSTKLIKQWFYMGLSLILQIWDMGFSLFSSYLVLIFICLSFRVFFFFLNFIGVFLDGSESIYGWWVLIFTSESPPPFISSIYLIIMTILIFQIRTYQSPFSISLLLSTKLASCFFDNLVPIKWQKKKGLTQCQYHENSWKSHRILSLNK